MRLMVDRLASLVTSETSQPAQGLKSERAHQADVAVLEAVMFRIALREITGRLEKR